MFDINENYQSKVKVIKVISVQKKETVEEIQETQNKVLQERQHLFDACIVRLLKVKKSITHNDLVTEVFNDLKLPCTVKKKIILLKKNVWLFLVYSLALFMSPCIIRSIIFYLFIK